MARHDFRRSIEAADGWIAVECEDGKTTALRIILPVTSVGIDLERDDIDGLIAVLTEARELMD